MKTLEEQQAYWIEKLSDLPPAVSLPADWERPVVSSFLRDVVSIVLEADLYERIKATGSPAVMMLAALNALVHRYTGSTDIAIAAPVQIPPGKVRTNLVVVRTRFSREETVESLIRQLFVTVAEAAGNSACPFSQVAHAAAHKSGAKGNVEAPLFHIGCDFSSDANGSSGSTHAHELARCDLFFHVTEERAGAATLECEYDSELFEPSTVQRFLQHWHTLLQGMPYKLMATS